MKKWLHQHRSGNALSIGYGSIGSYGDFVTRGKAIYYPPPKTPFLAMAMHPGPHTARTDPVNPLRVTWLLVIGSPTIGSAEAISVNAKAAGLGSGGYAPRSRGRSTNCNGCCFSVVVLGEVMRIAMVSPGTKVALVPPQVPFLQWRCNWFHTRRERGAKILSKEQRYSKWFD